MMMKKLLICPLLFGFMLSFHGPILAQNSEHLFQQGIIKEDGEGNLLEAIDIYNKIVSNVSADRQLRAKALLQVGICHEKLGDRNAIKSYQKLISEYSDQVDIVAIAKEKLKGLKNSTPTAQDKGIIAKQILFPEQSAGDISPDGRHLIYVDWTAVNNQPAIKIKDLKNGKSQVVSKVGTWEFHGEFPEHPIFSPDGKQFVYFWYDLGEEEGYELHIANVDGTNDKVVAKGGEIPCPLAWSPNGNYILGKTTEQIVLFSVHDGSLKVLKSLDGLKLDNMDISPDNKYIVYSLRQTKSSYENDIHLISMDGKLDKIIIRNSANDFNPRWSPDGKYIIFLSDRHGTNDLWKIRIQNQHSVGVAELIKSNLGQRASNTKILGFTHDQSLYYQTTNSRSDIYTINVAMPNTSNMNSTTRISNLNITRNTNPAITKDGRYIAFINWQLFRDADMGRPFCITIYDNKTGEMKNTNSLTYILSQLYWYWPKPQWSPNGNKILYQGRKREKENVVAAIFNYDIDSEEIKPIKVIRDYTKYTDIPSSGFFHVFSNDGKSMYYLSTDRKNIHKLEITSQNETVIYTNSNPMSFFKLSNDESRIMYVPFDNGSELYVASIAGGISTKIVSLNIDNTVYLIGWDTNDKHFYFGDGKYLDINTIMRVSVEGGNLENVINLEDAFPDGVIREIVIDNSGSTIALEVKVEEVEMWKLEGTLND